MNEELLGSTLEDGFTSEPICDPNSRRDKQRLNLDEMLEEQRLRRELDDYPF